MRKILKYTIYQIYIKRILFLIEIIMMLVAFLVLQYSIINNYSVHFLEISTKRVLMYEPDRVYRVNLDLYTQNFTSADTQNNLISFFTEMETLQGIEQSGAFYFIPMDVANNHVCDELFISTSLQKLCISETMYHSDMSGYYQNDKLCPVVVGSGLQDIYPLGMVFHNEQYDIECIVVKVLDNGCKWIAPQYSDLLYIPLDKSIIYPLDYFYNINSYYICNGINDAYIAISDDVDFAYINEQINKLAYDNKVILNDIIELEKMFDINVMRRRDVMGELVIMPVVLFLVASFTIVLISIISMKKNLKDYGIMLSNGMTIRDVMAIYFTENVIKINIAFWLAYVYWYFNIKRSFDYMFYALRDITVIMIICLFIFIILLNIIPKLVIQRLRPIDMIGRFSV